MRRVGFAAVGVEEAGDGSRLLARGARFSLRFDSSSSSRSSNCSICRSSFSDLRPNCMRCSLASSRLQMLDLALAGDELLVLCQDQRSQCIRRKSVQIGERHH